MDDIDRKLERINARLRDGCPVCEARAERAAIMEHDGGLTREAAQAAALAAHPCAHDGWKDRKAMRGRA